MPVVVLQTRTSEHLGFLLVTGRDSLAGGAPARYCALVGPPKAPALFHHPFGAFIVQETRTERACRVKIQEESLELSFTVGASRVHIELDTDLVGIWSYLPGEGPEERGIAFVPAPPLEPEA
jgi:hypothetical protein